jgi:hypothetical protein
MFTRFAGTRFVWFSCAWTADAVRVGEQLSDHRQRLDASHESVLSPPMRTPVGVNRFFGFFVGQHFPLPRRVAQCRPFPTALLIERFLFARCQLGVLVSAGAAT